MVTVYMTSAVRGLTGQGSLALSVATVIYIASCWAVVYLAGTCARAGSWVDFGVLAMAATLFACLCGVSLVAAALSRSTEITAATNRLLVIGRMDRLQRCRLLDRTQRLPHTG